MQNVKGEQRRKRVNKSCSSWYKSQSEAVLALLVRGVVHDKKKQRRKVQQKSQLASPRSCVLIEHRRPPNLRLTLAQFKLFPLHLINLSYMSESSRCTACSPKAEAEAADDPAAGYTGDHRVVGADDSRGAGAGAGTIVDEAMDFGVLARTIDTAGADGGTVNVGGVTKVIHLHCCSA